jgi:sugar O-acyltransferase (sialic acid O-acetyltransferase NeuD family)
MSPRKRVLYGAGSSILVDFEETCGRLGEELVAIVDNIGGPSFALDPGKIIALDDFAGELRSHPLSVALFTPRHRGSALRQARELGASCFAPLLDPTATLPASLRVAEGVFVNGGVVIGGMSELGAFSLVNRGACLGHHNEVGAFASIGPGVVAGGHVRFGRACMVGAGAVILPKVSIGANAVVGAGSVVTRDVPDNALTMGNPATVTRMLVPGEAADA